MSWLVWREFRLNRLILILGAALFLLPYVLLVIGYLWPKEEEPGNTWNLWRSIAVGLSFYLSQLTIAFLGAHAFTSEKMDRSAEFMAYLPVSKTRRLSSKLILAAVGTALVWGINLLVVWGLSRNEPISLVAVIEAFTPAAATGLVLFGVGWCFSSFQSSPTFAVCAGIAAPFLTVTGLSIAGTTFQIERDVLWWFMWYGGICTTLGLAGFAFGTWYFLKRVEP